AVTAAIFFLKCRAGWKPPAEIQVNATATATASGPVQYGHDEETIARIKEYAASLRDKIMANHEEAKAIRQRIQNAP
ncbi:MAG: hypothetical protein ACKO2G_16260, partial [Verrucomicrobiales bacterium]